MIQAGVERSDKLEDGPEAGVPRCIAPASPGCHNGSGGQVSAIAETAGKRTAGLLAP